MAQTAHQDYLFPPRQIFVRYKFLAIMASMIEKDSRTDQRLTSLRAMITILPPHLDFEFVPNMQKVESCPGRLSHQMLSGFVCSLWFAKICFSKQTKRHLLK